GRGGECLRLRHPLRGLVGRQGLRSSVDLEAGSGGRSLSGPKLSGSVRACEAPLAERPKGGIENLARFYSRPLQRVPGLPGNCLQRSAGAKAPHPQPSRDLPGGPGTSEERTRRSGRILADVAFLSDQRAAATSLNAERIRCPGPGAADFGTIT